MKPDGSTVDVANDHANDALVYDTTNGGTITSLGLQDHNKDYSNRAYVDHMFHYGYYIYAASVVAALDPERDTDKGWLAANKEKVNLLVRDIANPSLDDPYFPIFSPTSEAASRTGAPNLALKPRVIFSRTPRVKMVGCFTANMIGSMTCLRIDLSRIDARSTLRP